MTKGDLSWRGRSVFPHDSAWIKTLPPCQMSAQKHRRAVMVPTGCQSGYACVPPLAATAKFKIKLSIKLACLKNIYIFRCTSLDFINRYSIMGELKRMWITGWISADSLLAHTVSSSADSDGNLIKYSSQGSTIQSTHFKHVNVKIMQMYAQPIRH